MIGVLAGAALAGFAGSAHCVGMCGGFAVATGDRWADQAAWHVGRLGTYAVLGALVGWLGASLPGPGWVASAVGAVALVWFAGALAGILPEPRIPIPGLQRAGSALAARSGVLPRLAFGAVTGLLPCGLIYAALSLAIAAGDPLGGSLAMVVFGLGTVPALAIAAIGLRKILARSLWARRGLAAVVLGAGLWSVWARTGLGADGSEPTCHDVTSSTARAP